jgi:cytoplasmic iron level regulating protein YaaA (DUF328/UPF0246 family)
MLALLSPTKTLDLAPLPSKLLASQPALLNQTRLVINELQKHSTAQLKALLGVSDKLAQLNHERYREFDKQPAKQAMFAFSGPAFQTLAPLTFSDADVAYAQQHVRILSGVYGVLRPCDLIRPYRLDMGKKLKVGDSIGMYSFWGPRISEQLNFELPSVASGGGGAASAAAAASAEDEHDDDDKAKRKRAKTSSKGGATKKKTSTDEEEGECSGAEDGAKQPPVRFILNCASEEYSKSVVRSELTVPVVDVRFQEPSGRSTAIYSKRARGMMCRFVVQERVNTLEGIKRFSGGYMCLCV